MAYTDESELKNNPMTESLLASNTNVPVSFNQQLVQKQASGPPSSNAVANSTSSVKILEGQGQGATYSLDLAQNPTMKVRNDDLLGNLCDLIRQLQFDIGEDPLGDVNAVQTFLDDNPNLNLDIIPEGRLGATHELPLHLACQRSVELVRCLLAAGASPEAFCRYGRNALHCAVDADSLDETLLEALTERPARNQKKQYINSLDRNGDRSAVHYLADSPNQSLTSAFALNVAGVDWGVKNRKGNTAFEVAAKNRHWIITSYLARIQWARHLGFEDDFSVCRWRRIHNQNTAYLQAALVRHWNSDRDERLRNRILQHITPEFRFDRTSEDPVGGSGRDSGCTTKKVEKSYFTSIVIPYFSSEFTAVIDNREAKYRKDIKVFNECSSSNFNYLGLQCTSTLDEYCHPSLDSRKRNRDQVLSRYQSQIPEKHKIILTVPQLWIWAIDKDLITAMQRETFSISNIHLYDTIESFRDEFLSAFTPMQSTAPPTLFSDLFIAVLMSECISTLGSPSQLDLPDPVFAIFEKSISTLSDKVRDYTEFSELNKSDIDSEKKFILEISDIREELSMIQSVVLEQEQVWEQFKAAKFPESWISIPEDNAHRRVLEIVEILERPRVQIAKYKRQIAKLDADAQRVEESIKLQLDLKSKHASLQEAHQTSLMSAAVIGFTIVTIIFTPISFLASLLALSTSTFQSHQHNSVLTNGAPFYDGRYIAKWMVTVEFATIITTGVAILLALKVTSGVSLTQTATRISLKLMMELQGDTVSDPSVIENTGNERQLAVPDPHDASFGTGQDHTKPFMWKRLRAKSRRMRQLHTV